jgi:predicted DNA-binding transcriptional regulator YafY
MHELVLRHLAMLREIPRAPRRVTVAQLHERLTGQGHKISRRSLERDLLAVEDSLGLLRDDRTRPFAWSWPAGAPGLTAPGLSVPEALALDLIGRHLQALLPAQLLTTLKPRLAEARATLDLHANRPSGRWRDRVTVIDAGPPLQPPVVDEAVVGVVHAALFERKQIELDYRKVDATEPKRHVVHPVALVYQGPVGYLVATLWNYPTLCHLALHRMSAATQLDAPARQPADFDLQRYLREQEAFNLPSERTIRLQLRVDAWLCRHLDERRLSDDQRTTAGPGDGRWTVRATVQDSERLFWWLCSHGAKVEVVRPVGLRRRVLTELNDSTSTYRTIAVA